MQETLGSKSSTMQLGVVMHINARIPELGRWRQEVKVILGYKVN